MLRMIILASALCLGAGAVFAQLEAAAGPVFAQPEVAKVATGQTALREALTAALMDEYKARAIYRKVIEAHGDVRPFSNIVVAETRHIEALKQRFEAHGVPVPADDWDSRVSSPPGTLAAACQIAAQAEIDNAALYDGLLAATTEYPDVQETFRRLQAASRERHLPACQRCAGQGGGSGQHGRHGRF
jgi:rubrerythrin